MADIKPDRVVTINFKTNDGGNKPVLLEVEDAKSPYELWVLLPGNEGKSEAEYFQDIEGVDGPNLVKLSIKQQTISE